MKYVAVVGAPRESLRTDNSWSCFVGPVKEEVIAKALRAAQSWQDRGRLADYEVWVGTLNYKAVTPLNFELVKLPPERAKPA